MSDLRLNSSNDLDIVDHAIPLVTDAAAVAQHWAMRLRTVKGEWQFDLRVGVPYFEEIFGKPRLEAVEGIFRQVTLTTPGIFSIISFEMNLDRETRALSIVCQAKLIDLTTVTLTFTDLLLEGTP